MYKFGLILSLTWLAPATAGAQSDEPADGGRLFEKQCAICHGLIARPEPGNAANLQSWWHKVQVAAAPSNDQIAVALGYGPQLRGVIGRPAGTVEGFQYSDAFLAKLKGKPWDESGLDQWITGSQTMVPGTYMFYSQKNPEIRRRIIEYLGKMR